MAREIPQPDTVRSDPTVFLLKISDSSLKGSLQMLGPRAWGPIHDLPPTSFLQPPSPYVPVILNRRRLSARQAFARAVPSIWDALPPCLPPRVLRFDLSISPFKRPLLDFLPSGSSNFFCVSTSLPSHFTESAFSIHMPSLTPSLPTQSLTHS